MSELTNIHARAVKDLTTPTELPADPDALEQVKLVAGNFPTEYAGNEALTVKQIKDLTTSDLESKKANKTDVEVALSNLSTTANKYYPTLSEAKSHLATMSVNDVVTIGEEANKGLWYKATAGATILTRVAYDPLTQANNYTNNKAITTKTEAITAANNYTNLVFDAVPEVIAPYVAQAETAATVATIGADVFDTPEAGVDPVTGVDEGAYFNVRSTSDWSYIDEYQNVGGVATPSGKSYPSSAYVQDIVNYTARPFSETKVYPINARVMLENGDIVKSTIANNTTNPNNDMVGWVRVGNVYQVDTVEELLNIQSPKDGDICNVSDDLRGGKFEYKASRASENNGGTVFNGWVRKYFGSVYLDWFCETDPATTDCSLYMERALAVTRGVKCSGADFLFTGRVGIPDVKNPAFGNEQSNYAERQIKIKGDGDTTFHIDCAAHGRPTFTSARAKANPTTTSDFFVGKVEFKEINFRGVNTTGGFGMEEANKNLIDTPFDGDRLYNSSAIFCNFVHLRSALRCMQNRGANVEKGNNYTQSFNLSLNHFYHCTYWAEADEFINFRCNHNQGERNYAGIRATNPNDNVAFGVCSFDYNLFESGGVFIDAAGDIFATSIWNNYFEYNIFGDMPSYQSQINISGEAKGGVIGANNFGGQIDFVGYDTTYVDIRINGKAFNNEDGPVNNALRSKPVLIGNCTSSRQLITESRGLSIGNATPYTTYNGWTNAKTGEGWTNSRLLSLPFENDVAFTRGYFDLPFNYSALDKNGISRSVVNASNQMIVAILDLSQLEGGKAKNKMSTITGGVDVNLELKSAGGVSIANVSAKIHVGIYATARGSSAAAQYNEVRVSAKLLSILQPYDIPLVNNNAVLMRKQFDESLTGIVVEPLGGGKYALMLSNYTPTAVGDFGLPTSIVSSLTWQASVGCEGIPDQVGAGVEFSFFWW